MPLNFEYRFVGSPRACLVEKNGQTFIGLRFTLATGEVPAGIEPAEGETADGGSNDRTLTLYAAHDACEGLRKATAASEKASKALADLNAAINDQTPMAAKPTAPARPQTPTAPARTGR